MGRDNDDLESLPQPTGNGQDQPPADPGADDRSQTESGGNGQEGE